MLIHPYSDDHLDAIVRLSLRAWAPVFVSIGQAMDPDVYQHFYDPDWQTTQQRDVEAVCRDEDSHVWVAVEDGTVIGFSAVKLHADDSLGEIYMIAVDPDFQRQGIARALIEHSLEWLKQAGMSVAMVETGGDPGHAPARSTYQAAGFRPFPAERYFKKL